MPDFEDTFLGKGIKKIKQVVDEPADTGDILSELQALRSEVYKLRAGVKSDLTASNIPFDNQYYFNDDTPFAQEIVPARADCIISLFAYSVMSPPRRDIIMDIRGYKNGQYNSLYFGLGADDPAYREFIHPIIFDKGTAVTVSFSDRYLTNNTLLQVRGVFRGAYLYG